MSSFHFWNCPWLPWSNILCILLSELQLTNLTDAFWQRFCTPRSFSTCICMSNSQIYFVDQFIFKYFFVTCCPSLFVLWPPVWRPPWNSLRSDKICIVQSIQYIQFRKIIFNMCWLIRFPGYSHEARLSLCEHSQSAQSWHIFTSCFRVFVFHWEFPLSSKSFAIMRGQ